MFRNHCAAQYLVRMTHEKLQQGVFFVTEIQDALTAPYLVSRRIQCYIHKLQSWHLHRAAAPQQGPHARLQLTERERLDQVVIRAHVQALHTIIHLVEGREHEDWHGALALTQLTADFKAVESGQ